MAVDKTESEQSSYVVLARRYRPVQFEEVIGQEHVSKTLQNAIRAERVHHAYLFTGSRGVGKTTVARIMAKALNCEKGPTPTPCDVCDTCKESGQSVDVFEIDGASHTGVDDIRELRENVRYLPARARHKIYIIDEVHMLSTSAFNALLKTLEEPPPHVIFIFATTEPHKIPATILSRCQRFDFKRVALGNIVEHLKRLLEKEKVRVAEGGLSLIARASEGSVRDALSLLDQVIAYGSEDDEISAQRVAEVLGVADRRVLFELSGAILQKDAVTALNTVDRLFVEGQDLSQFARAFLAHLRDLVVVRTCEEPAPLVDATEAELKELAAQAEGPGAELLPQHFDRFAQTAEDIARSSFPRLLMEMALVEMVHAEAVLPLGDLLSRLEQLEARLGSGGGAKGGPGQGRPKGASRPFSAPRGPGAKASPATAPQKSAPPKAVEQAQQDSAERPSENAAAPPSSKGSNGASSPFSLPAGSPLQRWKTLINRVEKDQPIVASVFVPARLISWSDDHVELGYPAGSFELIRAKDKTKLEAFRKSCADLGVKLQIEIRELRAEEEASPEIRQQSLAEERKLKEQERKEMLRQEARDHPITKSLVNDFGAKIESIVTSQSDGDV